MCMASKTGTWTREKVCMWILQKKRWPWLVLWCSCTLLLSTKTVENFNRLPSQQKPSKIKKSIRIFFGYIVQFCIFKGQLHLFYTWSSVYSSWGDFTGCCFGGASWSARKKPWRCQLGLLGLSWRLSILTGSLCCTSVALSLKGMDVYQTGEVYWKMLVSWIMGSAGSNICAARPIKSQHISASTSLLQAS